MCNIRPKEPSGSLGGKGLFIAEHDEANVLLAVLLQVADQFVEVPVKGQPLYRPNIEHVGQAGVPDGENLFPDGLSHRNPPPFHFR